MHACHSICVSQAKSSSGLALLACQALQTGACQVIRAAATLVRQTSQGPGPCLVEVQILQIAQDSRQLFEDVVVHAVLLPLALSSVQVEARPSTKVPGLVLALNIQTSRRGVWGYEGNTMLCSCTLRAALGGCICVVASQAAQVVKDLSPEKLRSLCISCQSG